MQQVKCFEPCKPDIKHPEFRRTLKCALNKRIKECNEKASSFTQELAAIQWTKRKGYNMETFCMGKANCLIAR